MLLKVLLIPLRPGTGKNEVKSPGIEAKLEHVTLIMN